MRIEERLRKELDEIKIIKAELKEAKETYEELSNEYRNLIKSYHKSVPKDMFW